ncbi:major facilitator superfamily domain-containing protein [Nemania sp. FL0031]|nr:major facilitator superfamily domain-containing protein [Nemania sp. FL0031]
MEITHLVQRPAKDGLDDVRASPPGDEPGAYTTPDAEKPIVRLPDTIDTAMQPSDRISPARFWITILSLSLLGFISALDVTIIPPALPTIIAHIGGSTQYIWIANSFVLASSVLQPLVGQLANILGRKAPTIGSVSLFIIGSGIAGGASNVAMIIAGRAIQGVGAGGIYVLIDIVTCDFVPLRDRGKFLGIVQASGGVAAALGPVLGGVLAERNWRWIFYINIPICALPLLTIILFMHAHRGTGEDTFRNLDYVGNLVFTPSIFAILYGLISGGTENPWSSWRVIVPLALGAVGWAFFHAYQHFYAPRPSIPTRLFISRTSATGFALSFLSAILIQTAGFFLPIYFQSVLGTSVSMSGVYFLPVTVGILFSAAGAGVLLSKYGLYRPLHFVAFALSILGFGLFHLLGPSTHKAVWAILELIVAIGFGITISTILPAILAALPDSDVASANAAFSFVRTFGFTWGVTLASIIFNAVFNHNLSQIQSPEPRDRLRNGGAYAFASQAEKIKLLIDSESWDQILRVYTVSLRSVWWFGLGISVLALLLVGIEEDLVLSTELKTEYGLHN